MFQLKSNRPWLQLSALFGCGMALLLTPPQVAKADPIAYEVTTEVATPFSQFGTVDLATGAFKQTSVLGFVPTGISRIGSSLYTSTFTGTAFGQINPVTGAVTTISNTGLGGGEYLAMGSTLTTIYALDGSFNLYTVNPLTGAATLVGPTGLVLGLAYQLSTGSSALYFGDNNEIYSLNTSTGAPTAIGSTLLPVGGIDGLVFEHGGLYAGYTTDGSPPGSIYSIDPATGAATFIATQTAATGLVYGLAPAPIPEPSSLALLGLAALAFVIRRPKIPARRFPNS